MRQRLGVNTRLEQSREGRTGSDTQPVSVSYKRQHCFLCATPKTSLAGTGVNEERLPSFLSNTETESPSPLLMKKWEERQRRPLFYPVLVLGGADA